MKKILFAICIFMFAGILWAQETAPLNPEYVEWLFRGGSAGAPVAAADGFHRTTGRIPVPVSSWVLPEDEGLKTATPPSSYDLRNEGRSPAVRDQGSFGDCWAYAALACMEGNYLTKYPYGSIEYSTFNLVRASNEFWGTTLNSGGNYLISTSYFARMLGPVYEKDDPVDRSVSGVPPAPSGTTYIRGLLTGAEYVPDHLMRDATITDGSSLNTSAINYIKQCIMDKGVVDFSLCYESNYYNSSNCSFYCPNSYYANHEITIIGWDDNYSRSKFNSTAPGNGAWLARNSWGTDWGSKGCFWVSYYDMTATDYCVFGMTDNTSLYSNVYHVERKGLYTSGSNLWGAAKYTMKEDGTLIDTGSYVMAGGRTVNCYVYVNGTQKKNVSKSIKYPGYYMFRVNVPFASGDKIEVRFKYDTSKQDGIYYVPLSDDTSVCSSGMSMVSNDGSSWTDSLSTYSKPYAVCIKLYTKKGSSSTVKVTGVSLSASSMSLGVGESKTLKATVKPSDATNKSVTWSTSDSSVASVSSEGTVKGKAAGSAVITVKTKDGGYTATCKVTVKESAVKVTGVSLNKSSLTLAKGKSETLKATVKPSDATNKSVTWSSSDTSVATVTSSGTVKGVKAGSAKITVKTKDGGYTASCSVKVVVPVTGVSLSKTELSLKKGSTATLKATVKPSDASNKGVTWSSSDTSIASVSSAGVVTGKAAGSAKITVKTKDGGYTAACKVKVVVPVTGVSLNKTDLSLKKGATYTLKATVKPSDASNKGVTWSSSDTSIASVSSAGVVTGKAAGSAKITVKTKDGGYTAACKVKVVVPVTGVTLNKTSLTLAKGKSVTLKATVKPSGASNKAVTWSSSDTSIATVSSSGAVKGVKPGSAKITVKTKDGGYTAACKVTVVIPVTGVTLNKTTVKLAKGSTVTLKATVKPSDATNKGVTWTSDDTSIATVTSAGVVKGVKVGETKIRVKTKDGGFSAKCKIKVVVPVTGVSLNKTELSLEKGASYTLKATVKPSGATNKEVEWKSYDTSIVSVSSAGVVKALKGGKTKVRVKTKDGGFTAYCWIKVVIPVTGVSLNKTSISIDKGSTYTLKATVSPSDATKKTVKWKSADTSIATVSSSGVVKGVKKGTTTVRVQTSDGDFRAKCSVTVK